MSTEPTLVSSDCNLSIHLQAWRLVSDHLMQSPADPVLELGEGEGMGVGVAEGGVMADMLRRVSHVCGFSVLMST